MSAAEIRVFYSPRSGAEYTWKLLLPGEPDEPAVATGRAQTVEGALWAGKAKAAQLGLEVR